MNFNVQVANPGKRPQTSPTSHPPKSSSPPPPPPVEETPKDLIVNYIGKYIKQANAGGGGGPDSSQEGYDETLSNLREFLTYLEEKSIINTKQLEN